MRREGGWAPPVGTVGFVETPGARWWAWRAAPSSVAGSPLAAASDRAATPSAKPEAGASGAAGVPTLVLQPDPPNVLEHYAALVPMLAAAGFRILAVEQPGFGRSIQKEGGMDFPNQAAQLVELLEADASPPYVLALACVGGYAALLAAKARPDLVSHVVLQQIPAWDEELAWTRRIDRRGLMRNPVLGPIAMVLARKRLTRGWYDVAVPQEAKRDHFRRLAIEAQKRGARFPLNKAFRDGLTAQGPEFGVITQPTLAFWGLGDRSHRKTEKGSTRRLVPHARLVELEGVGHYPDLEAPERFVEELRGLVDR